MKMSCDGACTATGRAGAAWFDSKKTYRAYLPECRTNNEAEYTSLIKLLECIKAHHTGGTVTICMDSQLVVYQINGLYAVKNARLKVLYDKAQRLFTDTKAILQWVSRETDIMKIVDKEAKEAARHDKQ